MNKLICTCKTPFADCPIHLPRSKVLGIIKNEQYVMACLCDCGCTSCDRMPIGELLEMGAEIKTFYLDKKGKKHYVYISTKAENE